MTPAHNPSFLPDGQHVVFTGRFNAEEGGTPIFVGSLGAGTPILIGRTGSLNVLYAQGHLLFLRERTLMAWPFDAERLEPSDDPFAVVENVEGQGVGNSPYGMFSASSNGLLVYRSGGAPIGTTRLTWLDRQGTPEPVDRPGLYSSVELSPDDQQAVVDVGTILERDLRRIDLQRGGDIRVTSGAGLETYQVWSPDGRRIAFATPGRSGSPTLSIFEKSSDGTGSESPLLDDDRATVPLDWSDDWLLYGTLGGNPDVHVMSPSGAFESYALLDSEDWEEQAVLSPDRRWVAYVLRERGGNRAPAVYVSRVVPGQRAIGRIRVSRGPGTRPRWSGDGGELFYWEPDQRALMSVAVDGTGDATLPRLEDPVPLFPLEDRLLTPWDFSYDVTFNGQRILAVLADVPEAAAPITVIVNWTTPARR